MEKIDRRVKRTRKALTQAFVDLILEQGYESVTIKAITERADVAYMTFFRHYREKDDLLKALFEELMHNLQERNQELMNQESDLPTASVIFQHVEHNEALYRVLLNTHHLREQIHVELVRIAKETCQPFNIDNSLIPFEILCDHLASSQLNLLRWWLKNDKKYSIERMSQIYDKLIDQASWTVHRTYRIPQ